MALTGMLYNFCEFTQQHPQNIIYGLNILKRSINLAIAVRILRPGCGRLKQQVPGSREGHASSSLVSQLVNLHAHSFDVQVIGSSLLFLASIPGQMFRPQAGAVKGPGTRFNSPTIIRVVWLARPSRKRR